MTNKTDMDTDLTVYSLQKQCRQQANNMGWNDRLIPLPEMVALIHSEASEALECYRNDEPLSYSSVAGKPLGIGSEFADIIIRVLHYADLLGLDMTNEILRKLDYNATRGYRHGGKKA